MVRICMHAHACILLFCMCREWTGPQYRKRFETYESDARKWCRQARAEKKDPLSITSIDSTAPFKLPAFAKWYRINSDNAKLQPSAIVEIGTEYNESLIDIANETESKVPQLLSSSSSSSTIPFDDASSTTSTSSTNTAAPIASTSTSSGNETKRGTKRHRKEKSDNKESASASALNDRFAPILEANRESCALIVAEMSKSREMMMQLLSQIVQKLPNAQ